MSINSYNGETPRRRGLPPSIYAVLNGKAAISIEKCSLFSIEKS
jgi:hypothetical protein